MWELKQYKLFKVYKYWHFNENLSNYGKEDDKTVCKQITEIPNLKAEPGVKGKSSGANVQGHAITTRNLDKGRKKSILAMNKLEEQYFLIRTVRLFVVCLYSDNLFFA